MKRKHMLIGLMAFILGLSIGWIVMREPMEPLTPGGLSDAKERWHRAGITSYRARYRLNADLYEVTVEDRLVISISVNGQLPTTSDLRSFTVEGLFRVLEMELENIHDPQGPLAAQKDVLLARVRFHEELGYIERYLRSSAGLGRPASVEMLEFNERKKHD